MFPGVIQRLVGFLGGDAFDQRDKFNLSGMTSSKLRSNVNSSRCSVNATKDAMT